MNSARLQPLNLSSEKPGFKACFSRIPTCAAATERHPVRHRVLRDGPGGHPVPPRGLAALRVRSAGRAGGASFSSLLLLLLLLLLLVFVVNFFVDACSSSRIHFVPTVAFCVALRVAYTYTAGRDELPVPPRPALRRRGGAACTSWNPAVTPSLESTWSFINP